MEDKEKIVDEATIVKPNMASDRMKMILLWNMMYDKMLHDRMHPGGKL